MLPPRRGSGPSSAARWGEPARRPEKAPVRPRPGGAVLPPSSPLHIVQHNAICSETRARLCAITSCTIGRVPGPGDRLRGDVERPRPRCSAAGLCASAGSVTRGKATDAARGWTMRRRATGGCVGWWGFSASPLLWIPGSATGGSREAWCPQRPGPMRYGRMEGNIMRHRLAKRPGARLRGAPGGGAYRLTGVEWEAAGQAGPRSWE